MATIAEIDKQNARKRLESNLGKAICEILEKSRDKWVAVNEPGASFSSILSKNNIDKRWCVYVSKVLTVNGIIERTGDRSAIRYRYSPKSGITPDISSLVKTVIDYKAEIDSQYSANKAEARRTMKTRKINENGKVYRLVRNTKLPQIGDSRYMLLRTSNAVCSIVEVRIVRIERDYSSGKYKFGVVYQLDDDYKDKGNWSYNSATLDEFYDSPQAAAEYLIKNTVKFRGELFPSIGSSKSKQ